VNAVLYSLGPVDPFGQQRVVSLVACADLDRSVVAIKDVPLGHSTPELREGLVCVHDHPFRLESDDVFGSQFPFGAVFKPAQNG